MKCQWQSMILSNYLVKIVRSYTTFQWCVLVCESILGPSRQVRIPQIGDSHHGSEPRAKNNTNEPLADILSQLFQVCKFQQSKWHHHVYFGVWILRIPSKKNFGWKSFPNVLRLCRIPLGAIKVVGFQARFICLKNLNCWKRWWGFNIR